jgi:hypothetical protein
MMISLEQAAEDSSNPSMVDRSTSRDSLRVGMMKDNLWTK